MKLINVQQGSEEWLKLRADYFTASEAAAMMGDSKYQTRQNLLEEKATGIRPSISPRQQALFDKGHAAEASARPIIEKLIGNELYPVVGTKENLFASFDGLTMDESIIFEHKLWNESLAQQVSSDIEHGSCLALHYVWQLEHQLYVSDAEKAIFVCSDGTEDNMVFCWYQSQPKKRQHLLDCWQQFKNDLLDFGDKPRQTFIEAKATQPEVQLPSLRVQLNGSVANTNLVEYKANILSYIEQINENLETDQDFANAEAIAKQLDKSEKDLKAVEKHALSQTADIEALFSSIEHISTALRNKRLALNKLVKSRKEAIKTQILCEGRQALHDHLKKINNELPFSIPEINNADFAGAIKGKRTLKSMSDAVSGLLATAKVEAENHRKTMVENFKQYQEQASGFEFLFNDMSELILMEANHLKLIINSRINEYKASEEKRLEAERESIRAEEQRKAQEDATSAATEAQQRTDNTLTSNTTPSKPIPDATITIPSSEYELLKRAAFKLQCLENAGVDSWSNGYELAMEAFHNEYPKV